jgi:drug/metabolite transporter superfamily protein YnfA
VLAGLCEIGGGYLVWLWLREGRGLPVALLGAVVLFLYGVIPTLQPAHFGRVYAAYGGVFGVLSLLWGWVPTLGRRLSRRIMSESPPGADSAAIGAPFRKTTASHRSARRRGSTSRQLRRE